MKKSFTMLLVAGLSACVALACSRQKDEAVDSDSETATYMTKDEHGSKSYLWSIVKDIKGKPARCWYSYPVNFDEVSYQQALNESILLHSSFISDEKVTKEIAKKEKDRQNIVYKMFNKLKSCRGMNKDIGQKGTSYYIFCEPELTTKARLLQVKDDHQLGKIVYVHDRYVVRELTTLVWMTKPDFESEKCPSAPVAAKMAKTQSQTK